MLNLLTRVPEQLFRTIPETLILLLARFALATVFWLSGQTKIEGFAFNPLAGQFEFGLPTIKESTFFLFEYEYALPLIPANLAAYLATAAEHVLPILLVLGLFTRLGAAGILAMTLVIQLFVYPSAYALHTSWAAMALLLMKQGAGRVSLDNLLTR
ncbi:DoxX family protein [Marinomonas ostreistagni]|uniref:DoxX family protein n=1 Tax=Marinomonas ostreistagni TaxID=359209 RepID=A0ABS0ZBM9_9GAMM|nr:DoxX family protein [Marinomonas ostreistagni]MBJ7551066.1 DoxX family protein [Marinomonas ostreistagni]